MSNGQFSPESLASKAAAFRHEAAPDGFKWLALQEDGFGNAARIADFVAAAHKVGIKAGIWQTYPIAKAWAGIDFYMAELERPIDTRAFTEAHRRLNPSLSTWYITNLDTHGDPDYFKPLVDAGFGCYTEAYISDNPQATPERMEWQARQVGIPVSYPGPSLYAGPAGAPTLDDYVRKHGLLRWHTWAGYLAEYIL